MYTKQYAKSWIRHSNSGQDILREKFLNPYLKKQFSELKNKKILDVGCGWGNLLNFIDNSNEYHGTDIIEYFLEHIKQKFPKRNIHLKKGGLPNNLQNFPNNYFNIVLCSSVLHTTRNLGKSIESLFQKSKPKGKTIVIEFSNHSKNKIKNMFNPVRKETNNYIKGTANISSGEKIYSEAFFHTEEEIKKELLKHGKIKRETSVGIWKTYEVIKK